MSSCVCVWQWQSNELVLATRQQIAMATRTTNVRHPCIVLAELAVYIVKLALLLFYCYRRLQHFVAIPRQQRTARNTSGYPIL